MADGIIYLDCAATTKPCREAVAAMTDALELTWGNPSSTHKAGLDAKRIVDNARDTIFSSLGVPQNRHRADGDALIFCGSGTEANDLAILGVCRSKKRRGRVIISASEHASVSNAAHALEDEGFEVIEIPTRGGALDTDALRASVTPDTVLVSIMMVNSETGAHYDVADAFRIVRSIAPSAVCHVDAVQGYMKIPFTVDSIGADLCTVSAHKIHGPKGIGALYVSRSVIKSRSLSPVIFGGGQEGGYRSGTLNVPAIAGFGAAVTTASATRDGDIGRMRSMRTELAQRLAALGARPNLPPASAPHILSVTMPGIKSETMLNFLSSKGICVSSGSACSSHSKNVSRALLAFGLPAREADTTVRVSISRMTTHDEIDALVDAVGEALVRLARMK